MISFLLGPIISALLFLTHDGEPAQFWTYAATAFTFLVVSYWVAVIRFRVMAESIWAACIASAMRKAEAAVANRAEQAQ